MKEKYYNNIKNKIEKNLNELKKCGIDCFVVDSTGDFKTNPGDFDGVVYIRENKEQYFINVRSKIDFKTVCLIMNWFVNKDVMNKFEKFTGWTVWEPIKEIGTKTNGEKFKMDKTVLNPKWKKIIDDDLNCQSGLENLCFTVMDVCALDE